ncbi:unnamed protein product [Thelazia callipaeda]|uniref:G_PROTEIN_RECEP_F1_2 domain-containing protein n=1 Tax=Thelazia callipaeda TaxID=103827 RepID=A0A0N5D6B2_THECL|nr:unnamed protein product [Thelazia callipaeda]
MLETDSHSFLASIIALAVIIVISLLGMITNGLSLHIIKTNSQFRNAFGILCNAFLLCNIQTIAIMLIWGDSRELTSSKSWLALAPGCLANTSYYGSLIVHFLIAVNRYCAIAYPLRYRFFWSSTKTRVAAAVAYFLGFLPCIPGLFEPCTLVFNVNSDFQWKYSDTKCGRANEFFDTAASVAIMCAATCIDFVTLLKIRNHFKSATVHPQWTDTEVRRRDLRFFKQLADIGGLVLTVTSVLFNVGQVRFKNKCSLFLALFLVTTINGGMTSVPDG